MAGEAHVEVRGLRKSYEAAGAGRVAVVDIERFSVARGDQVALVGRSGSGKSTLLNLIAGILRPDEGTILIGETEITALGESGRDRFRADHVGYVFQSFNLLQAFTALENVMLGQMFARRGANTGRAREALARVGLSDRVAHRPREMSVGQQQRVSVARALVNRPELILADEPTASLDEANSAQVIDLLKEVCAESGATLLLVTHEPWVVERFAARVELARLNRAAALQ
ncbi:MAG: ABC transporter ATP-binding protein [Planctomycetes bacterium]|nr:ABC transporter ATP-binding protein [Planctomycetota bacterium]